MSDAQRQLTDRWSPLSSTVALSVVARAVSGSLRLDEVLRTVVRITCEVMKADRATILLLGSDSVLNPAVSHGRVEDPIGLSRFRQMPPLPVLAIPGALEALQRTDALVIPDVATSAFIPSTWKDAFGLTSLVLSPIVAEGECFGALVVDYADHRADFDEDEVLTLEGIAACTSTALRNARLYDDVVRRANNLDKSLQVTADLNAAATTRRVLDVALDGFLWVLAGSQASLHVLETGVLTTLAARGKDHPEPGRTPVDPREVEALASFDPGGGDVRMTLAKVEQFSRLPSDAVNLVIPMSASGEHGFAVVTCPVAPGQEALVLAQSVASQAALALDRARLTEQLGSRLEHLEMSYRMAQELSLAADLDDVVDRLARPVRATASCEVIDIFLRPGINSERFSSRSPGKQLASLMRKWSTHNPQAPVRLGGLLLVPMMLDSQALGIMRLRPRGAGPGSREEGYLMAIAAAVASVVSRADLNARVTEAQRQLTVGQERERIARDLHDTLGQSLFALGLQLADCLSKAPEDEELRSQLASARCATEEAAVQLRQAIHELSFLQRGRPSVLAALRELVSELPPGMNARVRSVGRAKGLSADRSEALLRVAREALVNVARHSRATDVMVVVQYGNDDVVLTVADNGVGLSQREGDPDLDLHFGIRSMRGRLEEAGGTLEIENLAPHGLRLAARLPVA